MLTTAQGMNNIVAGTSECLSQPNRAKYLTCGSGCVSCCSTYCSYCHCTHCVGGCGGGCCSSGDASASAIIQIEEGGPLLATAEEEEKNSRFEDEKKGRRHRLVALALLILGKLAHYTTVSFSVGLIMVFIYATFTV